MPFQMPVFTEEQLSSMIAGSPNRVIADVLNVFFSCSFTEWDVEYALGRKPAKVIGISSRLSVLECWNHPAGEVQQLVQAVSHRLRGNRVQASNTNWVEIAVRIALLFAAYCSLVAAEKIQRSLPLDVAVTTGDFAMPMAVWYARKMGLPVGVIICGCNSNGSFWDLLNRGEFDSGDAVAKTVTPDADFVIPRNLERLIFDLLGLEETHRYLHRCSLGRTYYLPEEARVVLSRHMFAAVCSNGRMRSIINGVYRTRSYVLSPYGALAYASLQDYRAITGESRPALLVAERSPLLDSALVSRILRMEESHLRQHLSD